MRRSDLEHAIRAATEIIQADAIIVIGSQAILGSFTEDELPDEAIASVEVDMAPMNDDDAGALATALDGAIGELSQFHETNGYYVQGVGRETAVLPQGWEDRLVPVANANTRGRTGLCLDPHDLCLAKLAAARQKDYAFVGSLIEAGLVDPAVMSARVQDMTTADPRTHVSIMGFLDGQVRAKPVTEPTPSQSTATKPKSALPGQQRVHPASATVVSSGADSDSNQTSPSNRSEQTIYPCPAYACRLGRTVNDCTPRTQSAPSTIECTTPSTKRRGRSASHNGGSTQSARRNAQTPTGMRR